jgi:hypothetical protein
MVITESRPAELIRLDLDFVKPMKARNLTEFTFKPEGDHTVMTWTMSGTNNFLGKAVGLVMNCEKMVGGFFEQGLANIKNLTETTAAARTAGL